MLGLGKLLLAALDIPNQVRVLRSFERTGDDIRIFPRNIAELRFGAQTARVPGVGWWCSVAKVELGGGRAGRGRRGQLGVERGLRIGYLLCTRPARDGATVRKSATALNGINLRKFKFVLLGALENRMRKANSPARRREAERRIACAAPLSTNI